VLVYNNSFFSRPVFSDLLAVGHKFLSGFSVLTAPLISVLTGHFKPANFLKIFRPAFLIFLQKGLPLTKNWQLGR